MTTESITPGRQKHESQRAIRRPEADTLNCTCRCVHRYCHQECTGDAAQQLVTVLVAGMCFTGPFACGIWGLSPLRAHVGAHVWPAGFEKGSLCGGKPFLTHLLT